MRWPGRRGRWFPRPDRGNPPAHPPSHEPSSGKRASCPDRRLRHDQLRSRPMHGRRGAHDRWLTNGSSDARHAGRYSTPRANYVSRACLNPCNGSMPPRKQVLSWPPLVCITVTTAPSVQACRCKLLWCILTQAQPPSASWLANSPQVLTYASPRNATQLVA